MQALLEFAAFAFSATFVIIDPLGVVPMFIVFTPNDTPAQRQAMARRATFVAWAILTAFALGGSLFFKTLGVSPAAFRVAGGLLLLITAVDQLRAQPSPIRTSAEETKEGIDKEDVSIVPLAMPLLAGPGSIATVMMLTGRAANLAQLLIVLGAIALTLLMAFVALLMSDRIERMLGKTGRRIIERLGGLVLAALAVQFIFDGVHEAWRR